MSMSAGGNDGLFKLAENAAPDENRLMPAERTYPKGVGAVSLEEAVALMKQRKMLLVLLLENRRIMLSLFNILWIDSKHLLKRYLIIS